MLVTHEYDQDPRYGWASIDLEGAKEALIVVHGERGSHGFMFKDDSMVPTCICSAWNEDECSCPNVEWRNSDD